MLYVWSCYKGNRTSKPMWHTGYQIEIHDKVRWRKLVQRLLLNRHNSWSSLISPDLNSKVLFLYRDIITVALQGFPETINAVICNSFSCMLIELIYEVIIEMPLKSFLYCLRWMMWIGNHIKALGVWIDRGLVWRDLASTQNHRRHFLGPVSS